LRKSWIIKLVFRPVDVHKLRNFAEDLSRSLEDIEPARPHAGGRARHLRDTEKGLGSLPMSEADSAVDVLVVTKIRTSRIRRCRRFIETLLEKHFLKDDCEIIEQAEKA
jgi:hypothetical protein